MARAKDEANGMDEEAPSSTPEAQGGVAADASADASKDSSSKGVPKPARSPAPGGARRPDVYRLLALGIAALMLFPLLARSGIWDPYELDAADLARRIALR